MSKYCTKCGSSVDESNKFCNNCGNHLSTNRKPLNNNVYVNNEMVINDKNPWLAALLSFFLLGFGQFYNGQILKGITFLGIFFFLIFISLATGQAGFLSTLFLFYIVYDAYKSARNINANMTYSTVRDMNEL